MKQYLIIVELDIPGPRQDFQLEPTDNAHILAYFQRDRDDPAVLLIESEGDDSDQILDLLRALPEQEPKISQTIYRFITGLRPGQEDLAAEYLLAGADEVQFGEHFKGELLMTRLDALRRRASERGKHQLIQARLEEAQQLGNLGNWRYSLVEDTTWWSAQVYRIVGLEPSNLSLNFDDYITFVHPEDRHRFRLTVEEAVARGEGYEIEHRLTRRDGEVRTVHCSARALFEEGTLIGLTGVIQDITERRRVEEALRSHQEILTYISNELPAALYQCRLDPQGQLWIDYFSAGSVNILPTQAPRQSIPIELALGHIVMEDRGPLIASTLESAQTLEPWEDEFRITDKHGDVRWILGRSSPVKHDDGSVIWYGVLTDITSRKELEEQLHLADRLASIGTLAAGIAHEINNPLAFILSNLEFAREEAPSFLTASSAQAQQEVLNDLMATLATAYDGASRIGTIVQGLMGFARHDSEGNGPVDLREVCAAALRIVNSELRQRARLVVDIEQPTYVQGNEGQICQVLVNLLLNAVQAMPEDRVNVNTVGLRFRGLGEKSVVIEVEDNGEGIHDETKKRLFDPFFSTKPIGQGTGLGLYVCHNLLAAMNGRLEIESSLGKGTLARVILPAAEPPAFTEQTFAEPTYLEEAEPLVTTELARPSRYRVLVVDDEPDLVDAIVRGLRHQHEVQGFVNAAEALAAIDGGERFDAVLLDVLMPQMDGIELFHCLTQKNPELIGRIGFLSGGAFKERARKFLDEQQPPCLNKPFKINDLKHFVQGLLETVILVDS